MADFCYFFFLFLSALTGLVSGSFLNVVICRLPLMIAGNTPRLSLSFPPSHCPHCKRAILKRDNIPLLSFFLLAGRCRFCRREISRLYPLTEGLSALIFILLFLLIYPENGLPDALLVSLLCCGLYCGSIIDMRYYLIPDRINLFIVITGLLFSYLHDALVINISGALLWFILLRLIFAVYARLRGKEVFGYGDIKLLAAVVPWVGAFDFPWVMTVSAITGMLFYPLWMKVLKARLFCHSPLTAGIDDNCYLPFAPVIAFSTVGVLLWLHVV